MGLFRYDFRIDLTERNDSHTLMVEMVPRGSRVLDVGCATGRTSAAFRQRGCRVVGIERDPEAASEAREYCEEVLVADVEELDLHRCFGSGSFDVIVFGDVLEHLRDPVETLRRIRALLSPEGCVVASIPNVAHGAVRLALLQGRFDYQPLGLLDETHLRFFTRDSLEQMFRHAGYLLIEERSTTKGIYATEIPVRRADFPRAIRRFVESDPGAPLYQFVVRAIPAPDRLSSGNGPRVAVIIPNFNGEAHLSECLDSLTAQTLTDFETIVVDNGSTDGSRCLVRDRYPWVRMITLGENRGFSAAVNAGIRASNTEYVVLLNNDTRACSHWLEHLVRTMDELPQASLGASKMLRYEAPDVVDAAGDAFSLRDWAGVNIGAGEPASRYDRRAWVFGACAGAAIYRRSLFEELGAFDEDFFLTYEDVDVDLRAQLAGHRCIYVPEAVIYHKRGASTDRVATEFSAVALRNRIWVAGKGLPPALLVIWAGFFLPRLLIGAILAGLIRRLAYRGRRLAEGRGWSESAPEPPLAESAYIREVIRSLRELPRKRKEVQAARRVGSLRLLRVLLRPHRPLRAVK